MPTLVVHGAYDYGIPWMICEDMVAGLDTITLEFLENSSHSPQTQHLDDFDPRPMSWLANL